MFDLSGQFAIVTGGGAGIGKAIALELARCGAGVAICGRRPEPLAETADEIGALGRRVFTGQVDVADSASVVSFVANAVKEFGKIDILVNNAGVTKDNLLMRMTEEEWDAVLDTNLKGAFLFSKALARPMMKQRSGAIVNIASVVAQIGNAGQCNYSASKAGLIAMTKSMAKELASRGIRVTLVCPGRVKTNISFYALDKGGRQHGKMDPGQAGGLSPEAAARKIARAFDRGRREVLVGRKELIMVYIKRFFPGLCARLSMKIKSM